MKIEYEAAFIIDSKDRIRNKLKSAKATLVNPEVLQKRVVFHLPKGSRHPGSFARVRDEGYTITMSIKQVVEGGRIDEQFETCFQVSDFDEAIKFLEFLGCKQKAYQETKRELWKLDDAEITIDEWPFLEPFIEIEAPTEEIVKSVSAKLGFDYSKAYFGPVGGFYAKKYGISLDRINNQTPEIVFQGQNPFLS